jgi:hypothetical protein
MRAEPAGLSAAEEQPRSGPPSSRTRVVVALALAVGFGCAFVIVAVVLGVDAVVNHGTVGVVARTTKGGRASPASGLWGVVVCLAVGGAWLVRAAIRALRQESYLGIVVPLGILLVLGTVGEISDLLGTASRTSDLVGAAILLMAAVPVALLWRPLRDSYDRMAVARRLARS